MQINQNIGPEDDDEDEDVIVHDEGGEDDNEQTPDEKAVADAAAKKKKAAAEAEDDDDVIEEEERPSKQHASEEDDGLTDEQRREKKREERRAYRARKRQRTAAANETIKSLQDGLAKANAQIAKLQGGREGDYLARVDAALVGANNRAAVLKQQIKQAGENGEFEQQAELIEQQIKVRADIGEIEKHKTETTEALKKREKRGKASEAEGDDEAEDGDGNDRRRGTQAPVWDLPTIERNVGVFAAKMPWYKIRGTDEDSVTVRKIDKQLTDEGSRPDSTDHWQELEERIREELPHRFQKGKQMSDDNRNGKRPNVSGGGGRGGNGGESGFKLSKERVAAMKEQGTWDDPVAKKRMVAYFKKYDAEQASKQRNN